MISLIKKKAYFLTQILDLFDQSSVLGVEKTDNEIKLFIDGPEHMLTVSLSYTLSPTRFKNIATVSIGNGRYVFKDFNETDQKSNEFKEFKETLIYMLEETAKNYQHNKSFEERLHELFILDTL